MLLAAGAAVAMVVVAIIAAVNYAGGVTRMPAMAQMSLFWLLFWRQNLPVLRVTDLRIARKVLAASSRKGWALEHWSSLPAWDPVVSLESVDGTIWRQMHSRLVTIMAVLPPVGHLRGIAEGRADELVARGCVIDGPVLVRWTVQCLVEYLFGQPWRPEFDVLCEASWEWRRKIAIRGGADLSIQQRAIDCTVALLRETPILWNLFNNDWTHSEFFSLILQPFLISPAINVGDVAVTLAQQPPSADAPSTRVTLAMHAQHPFPLLERFISADVVVDGVVVVPGGTQVLMFTEDFASQDPGLWNPFGGGPRVCAGIGHAHALLETIVTHFCPSPAFAPARDHRYSGRHNDTTTTFAEHWYFVKQVVRVLREARVVSRRAQHEK